MNNKFLRFLLAILILNLTSFNANAMTTRRAFLRGLMAVGAAPLIPPPILGGSGSIAFAVTHLERDFAEIMNIQRDMVKIPGAGTSIVKQQQGFIDALRELELFTPEGQATRNGLVSQLEAGLKTISSRGVQKLETPPEKINELQTKEGLNVFNSLSTSLMYNLIMIRSLLSTRLLMKLNAQIGYGSNEIAVNIDEYSFLIDYYQLLELNTDKFLPTEPGFNMLQELLTDIRSWFQKLSIERRINTQKISISSCRAILK